MKSIHKVRDHKRKTKFDVGNYHFFFNFFFIFYLANSDYEHILPLFPLYFFYIFQLAFFKQIWLISYGFHDKRDPKRNTTKNDSLFLFEIFYLCSFLLLILFWTITVFQQISCSFYCFIAMRRQNFKFYFKLFFYKLEFNIRLYLKFCKIILLKIRFHWTQMIQTVHE